MSTWIAILRELGLVHSAQTIKAPEITEGAFGPADLTLLQDIFDQACRDRDLKSPEQKAAIARFILESWKTGERDPQVLLDAALAVRT